MKTAIVVAHHLPTLEFLEEWKDDFDTRAVKLFICEDKPKRETTLPSYRNAEIKVYTHADIDKDLGKKSWIIPRRTSAVKSYGFYKAWQDPEVDVIITVDNDCFPDQDDFVSKHRQNLRSKATLGWTKTLPGWYTRGFPYGIREQSRVVITHGVWSNIPDFDAPTQLLNPDFRAQPELQRGVIPYRNYYAMCGMNVGFAKDITPLMYFGLQGPDWPYDRFDDIWAGIFSKKIIDHLGHAAISGSPSVEHRKQSDVFLNLKKEAPGIEINEQIWKDVDAMTLTATDPVGAYRELIAQLPDYNEYFTKLKEATNLWLDLYDTNKTS